MEDKTMKAILIYNKPYNWLNPFSELSWYEPITYKNTVEELIHETPFKYKIEYTIPEMKKRDLKIRIENERLVIEGFHKESNNKLFRMNRNESESSFYKSTVLTEGMDVDNLKAKFKSGVLTITIPKKKEYINYREIPVSGDDSEVENAKLIEAKSNQSILETAKNKLRTAFRKAA